ncbi:exodeoxyribonuclease V subunit beta [Nevskia sp.]|uniref:UvrD-helicase domain-containing protein n=1 Tax=Nevskia sp. TaxID=1929292 RepID=UPI0025F93E68|nr:UvrD-helicase domain-containing protein [Nevskia sp.]
MSKLALDPTRSVSVTASAGSGKTWQLVSRIVRLLLNGADPGGILALTFTRKAAAEMRERVETRLRELAFADDAALDKALRELDLVADDSLRALARSQYERLLHTPFGLRALTLHAFCQDLLTRFAIEAGIPPGYTLLEDEREVLAEAWTSLLDFLHRHPDSLEGRALATLISDGATENKLRGWLDGFVQQRSDWRVMVQDWPPEELIPQYAALLADELSVDPDDDTPPEARLMEADFVEHLTCIHDLLVAFKGLGSLKAEMAANALAARDGAARFDAASKFLTGGERRVVKIKKGVGDADFARLSELYEAICTTVTEVASRRLARHNWQRGVAAATLGVRLLAARDEALRTRNALGFDDLEWQAWKLLRGPDRDWVQYKLDRRIEHLLLDEFQDTSPTQWSLLLPILDNMADDAERPRSAFVVGDPKQSIYGFRRANPELLARAGDYLRDRLGGIEQPLNDSRRSAPAVIAFVNALFSGDDATAIRFEPHATYRKNDWGAVEVLPRVLPEAEAQQSPSAIAGRLRDPLTEALEDEEASLAAREGAQVAARIRALIDARLPVAADGQPPRALGYADVMILARERTHLRAIEQALSAARIPFVGSARGGLLDTLLARDLMALLRLLDSPQRNLDLAHVLRSPMFAASDDDLVRLARAVDDGRDWWSRLQALAARDAATPVLAPAARSIGAWLRAASRLPAHDLLDRIDGELDLAARYEAAMPADRRIRANLGALMQAVLNIDQGRYPTLGRLNRELAKLAASGKDAPDEAPPATADAVRVMTVHASKGLEAPAVFVVNTAPQSNERDAGWLVDWPSEADRPRAIVLVGAKDDRDAQSAALIAERSKRQTREALNLLYVATTRARQYLFVSAFSKKQEEKVRRWHQHAVDAMTVLVAKHGNAPLDGAPNGTLGIRMGAFPEVAAAEVRTPVIDSESPLLRQRLPSRPGSSARSPSDSGTARDPDAVLRGRAIHWLIEQLARGRTLVDTAVASQLEAQFGEPVDPTLVGGWLTEARAVIAAQTLAWLFDAGRLQRAWNEVPVQWRAADGTANSGVLDRLIDDGAHLTIIDYKTAPRPNAERLIDAHRGQLAAYADAIGQVFPGREIRAGLLLTATREWRPVLERP